LFYQENEQNHIEIQSEVITLISMVDRTRMNVNNWTIETI